MAPAQTYCGASDKAKTNFLWRKVLIISPSFEDTAIWQIKYFIKQILSKTKLYSVFFLISSNVVRKWILFLKSPF